MACHLVPASQVHHVWDRELEPAVRVRSGEVVRFECPRGGDPAMEESSTLADLDLDAFRFNLVGPVHVEGAEPGDTLEVEVLAVEPAEWGFTMIVPGLGLLPDEFPEAYLTTWDLRERTHARLGPGVRVPLAPFLGTMGTHPGEPARAAPIPPHRGGGNIDNRHLTRGARLWLPVWCAGALFSCGDGHAAQGDGEVCVSAIECEVEAELRLTLHRRTIGAPRFEAPPRPDAAPAAAHGTMGISGDLLEGARIAARELIAWLVEERGLSREDAYVLCSVAADLKLLEVVDEGVWNVGMTIPHSLFE